GTVISSSGTGTIVTNAGGVFGGQINGDVNLGRIAGGTFTLSSAQGYNGATVLLGGTTTLENDATILFSSRIDINYATLFLSNNTGVQTQNNNRIGDGIAINMKGGTVTFTGRISNAASEVMGELSLLEGANSININASAGTIYSADLTFAKLNRADGTTINFSGTNLGQAGNTAHLYFTDPLTTVGTGFLGAWAIANSTDYAAYNTANGVGVAGNGGYAGYDPGFGPGMFTNLNAALNLGTVINGDTTTGLLRLGGVAQNDLTFADGGDILNLELGGILRQNNAFSSTIGTLGSRGVITAGGDEDNGVRELIIYSATAGNPTFFAPNTAGVIAVGSAIVTLSSTSGLLPGMTLSHASFPAGTTVVEVLNATQVLLSQNATVAAQNTSLTAGSYITGVTTLGLAQVTMNSTVGLAAGMTFTGTGVPAGTYIVSVDSLTQVTLSQ
ncbi:MAG: hypothetical protein Q8N51_03785, partial [Gammaproteobacteria bacterium]|nr:hypothetical protein [Gammaproteobacteria bacterium]